MKITKEQAEHILKQIYGCGLVMLPAAGGGVETYISKRELSEILFGNQIKYKTRTSSLHGNNERYVSLCEFVEIGRDGDDAYIRVEHHEEASLALVFSPDELKKIRDDIDKVLKSYV